MNKVNTFSTTTCCAVCAAFASLVLLPTSLPAQQWQFEPEFRLAGEYNDNIRLNLDDQLEIDGTAFVVDAMGRIVRRDETSEVRLDPRIRYRDYSDGNSEDSTDLFLSLFARNQFRRGDIGFEARLSREDVLRAEIDDPDFDNPDVNDPVNIDTGRIRVANERDRLILAPYFNFDLSETVGFGINANYIDVDYDEMQASLVDFRTVTVGTGLSFKTKERSTWSIRVFATDYETESGLNPNESDSVGANIRFDRQFSQTLDGWITVGYENIDSDSTLGITTTSESSGSTLFSAGLIKEGEISRVVFDVSQKVDPGGAGFLQERSQLRLRYQRRLSPRLSGSIEGRVQNTDELSALANQIERDFHRLRFGLEWRLSRKWSILGDYTFTSQEFSNEDQDASSNAVSIGVLYKPARVN